MSRKILGCIDRLSRHGLMSRMKKRYQIRKQQQAVERFQSWAASRNEPIQLSFPTADVAELMQQSLGELLRSVGKLFIETVM